MIAIKLALVTKRLNIDLASQKPIPLVLLLTHSHTPCYQSSRVSRLP